MAEHFDPSSMDHIRPSHFHNLHFIIFALLYASLSSHSIIVRSTIQVRTIITFTLRNIVTFILHPYATLQTTIPSPLSYSIDSKRSIRDSSNKLY
ncbi:hypothetical protein EYC84_004089 [Monilinia fructicola]|uniref:Uncharacterized protein n=1 Tax=Monilinia fructicola TaxID=38448 RepID=A0A5M9K7M7_MONFR|nr:hypothetical protein EYC84_004089 [Monilinia fructicola]